VRRYSLFLHRYWLVAYWLAFACVAALAAQDPGYVLRSQPLPPFPWAGLGIIWLVLAAETYGLHFFLNRGPVGSSLLWRLAKAVLYSLVLSTFFVVTSVTDQGGLFYVPMWFALASLVLFGAAVLAVGVTQLWQRMHAAP